MPNSGVVADTSVWIKFFNDPDSPEKLSLAGLIQKRLLFLTGVEIAEVLQGVRTESEKTEILSCMSVLPFLGCTLTSWIRIGELSALLRRRGLILPLSDIAIASLSLEHGCSVFTLDKHFEKIPGLTLHRIPCSN